jgi:hypothetical protein
MNRLAHPQDAELEYVRHRKLEHPHHGQLEHPRHATSEDVACRHVAAHGHPWKQSALATIPTDQGTLIELSELQKRNAKGPRNESLLPRAKPTFGFERCSPIYCL